MLFSIYMTPNQIQFLIEVQTTKPHIELNSYRY